MTDTLIIEIVREGTKLKMSAVDKTDEASPALKHYSELNISPDEIDGFSNDITECLKRENQSGYAEANLLSDLKKSGSILYDSLLTDEVKTKLYQRTFKHLIFSIDETLIQIPWELLHDSDNFLCLKYSIGRSILTKQKPRLINRQNSNTYPLRMMILADPTGDLESAYKEGAQIRNEMDQHKNKVRTDLFTTELTHHFVKKNIRDYDIIHFAGHAERGWLFKDGKLTADDIIKLGGSAPMPSIVFSNGCESASTDEWPIDNNFQNQIYGLANAFLLAGTKHYIGTFWKVQDESSFLFAKEFYKQLIQGSSTGEALRLARKALMANSIIWASYVLYGDPSDIIFKPKPVQDGKGFWIRRSTQYLMAAGLILAAIILTILFIRDYQTHPHQGRTNSAILHKR